MRRRGVDPFDDRRDLRGLAGHLANLARRQRTALTRGVAGSFQSLFDEAGLRYERPAEAGRVNRVVVTVAR